MTLVERAVAEVIARHMNREGVAWPGYELIAKEAHVSTRSVQVATKAITEGDPSRGLLPLYTRRRRHGEGGRAKSYEYRLVEHPEALVRARQEGVAKLDRIDRALTGRAVETELRLNEPTKSAADEIRRRELELQSLLIKEEIPQAEYESRLRALKTQRRSLARALKDSPCGEDR